MKQEEFLAKHSERWNAFAEQLERLERGTKDATEQHKPPFGIDELPARYREVCQHLALARDRGYGAEIVNTLSGLALRGHQVLYSARLSPWQYATRFLFYTFPHAVRRDWRIVLLSMLLFFGPFFAIFAAIQSYPDFAEVILPAEQLSEMESMYDGDHESLGRKRDAGTDMQMFGFYIFNNVRIGFQTFAGGVIFTLGSLFYLLVNGIMIGAIAGHIVHAGHSVNFFSFTSGHSAFELTAIALSGAAGIKLGLALIAPGNKTRVAALRDHAAQAVPIIGGAAVMLLIAAGLEAFWSPRTTLPLGLKYSFGIAMWLLLVLFFLFSGRNRAL